MHTENSQNETLHNQVLKAHELWNTISPQVKDVLGEEVFSKWFEDLIPLTINNRSLILQTNAWHACLWIRNNYQETLDLLSALQEENLKTSLVAPGEDISSMPLQH